MNELAPGVVLEGDLPCLLCADSGPHEVLEGDEVRCLQCNGVYTIERISSFVARWRPILEKLGK
jgi:hypothetical protein